MCSIAVLLATASCAIPVPQPTPHVVTTSRNHGERVARSWVSANAKGESLLYVSDGDDDAVWIFSYPKGELKGMLYGFGYPHGACVDKNGDIFITDLEYQTIFEYPHGSAKPKAVLIDKPYSNPNDCSVDPTTGDLAVSHSADYNLGIAIYRQAQQAPTYYADPNFFEYEACGYDSSGNLFVVGIDNNLKLITAELAKGSSTFADIRLRRLPHAFAYSGGIKWDGKYVALDDLDDSVLYQLRVQASVGTVVGSTKFADGYYTGAFWFPNLRWGQNDREATQVVGSHADVGVQYWSYPAGGTSVKELSAGNDLGVTISPAKP